MLESEMLVQTATKVSDADAEQLLHDLVSVPSISYQEQPASELLVNWMNAHGYDQAYVDEVGNAVGIIGSGADDVMLLGHIDTFPGFPPVRRDGRSLYGRGSVDAKGPLCTFAVAAARAMLPPNLRVVVIGAVEEEAPTSRGALNAAKKFKPKACLIGEPSRWDRITLGYKGRMLLNWRWEGPLAHSAGQPPSPAEHAVAYWQQVVDYTERRNTGITTQFERLSPSLRDIHTGRHGAYGWAEMTLGLRIPPGVDPNDVVAAIIPKEGQIEQVYGTELAYVGEKDSPLTRALRGGIRAIGGQPRFLNKTGTSDMNVVGHVWRCPIAAYGPGDSALDHTPDEHTDLDEYLKAVRVLTHALDNFAFSGQTAQS